MAESVAPKQGVSGQLAQWVTVDGSVQQGHQVASGHSQQSPYPAGTIALQTPHFRMRGLDLSAYYPGTINVAIAPYHLGLESPPWTIRDLVWLDGFGAETFSFSPCYLWVAEQSYSSLIYYPHPETKIDHHQNSSIVEILAPYIPNLSYGDSVQINLNLAEVSILLP